MKKQPTSRMCFVCGESNPAGVHVRFYEGEDGLLLARHGCRPPPRLPGRMHGGVITAIMTDHGPAIMIACRSNLQVTANSTSAFVSLCRWGRANCHRADCVGEIAHC
jgi:hypothetical protein